MRCPKDNNVMLDPLCYFENEKKEKPVVLVYRCDKCQSVWCFKTINHWNYTEEGNTVQEITKDGKIIMYSKKYGYDKPSDNQNEHFMQKE